MSAEDRNRWDARYVQHPAQEPAEIAPDPVFAPFVDEFPITGHALDIACGRGTGALWLAQRGLRVLGCDVSPVAIAQARRRARDCGLGDQCRFDVVDLDDGLPQGPAADVLYCTRFRDRRLDAPMIARLAPGGLLAVTALSQVGGGSGRFRAAPGELRRAFDGLTVIAAGEAQGVAWLLARRGS